MRIPLIVVLFAFFFVFLPTLTAACNNEAKLIEAEISIEDNSFSYNFDGTSGIITRIIVNESTNKYSLWQTPNLPYRTDKGYNFRGYDWTKIPFLLDSSFNARKYQMLILNLTFTKPLEMYSKVTIQNTGSCGTTGSSWIKNNQNFINYYGIDNYRPRIYLYDSDPDWEFTNAEFEENQTIILRTYSNDIDFEGKVNIRIGPNELSGYDPQRVDSIFWLEGPPSVCGDGIEGHLLNGDLEACDSAIFYANFTCNATCDGKIPICGDGRTDYTFRYYTENNYGWQTYGTRLFTPPEVCDTANNPFTSYNCSNDCSQRDSVCGNNLLEIEFFLEDYHNYSTQEQCDDGNILNGDGCSDICEIEPYCGNNICEGIESYSPGSNYCPQDCYTTPIVTYENYNSTENMLIGHNLTPGQIINLRYKAINNDPSSKTILFDSRLSGEFYSQNTYEAKFHNNSLANYRILEPLKHFDIPIAPNSTVFFNRTFLVPNLSIEEMESLSRLLLYERMFFKPENYSNSGLPGQTSYGYVLWQTGSRGASPDWQDQFWNGTTGGFGSYYPQYCISGLEPNPITFAVSSNEEGIPTAQLIYHKGLARSNFLEEIPANAFYLNNRLDVKNVSSGIISPLYSNKKYINRSIRYTHLLGNKIHPYSNSWIMTAFGDNLSIEETILFPIYDFEKVNNQEVRFNSIPYVTQFDSLCALSSNVYTSQFFPVYLDTIFMELDNPLVLYPYGGGGYDELYGRLIFFNYEDFTIFDVNIDISITNEGVDKTSDFEITYDSTKNLPAKSTIPLGIKFKYNGPVISSQEDFVVNIETSYIEPISNNPVNKAIQTDLILMPNIVSGNETFVDLLPINIDFTLLNINKNASLRVNVANQGTKDSGPFTVKLYAKTVNESSFTLVSSNPISNIGAQGIINTSFVFIPTSLEQYLLKIVVDEENAVFEDPRYVKSANNNQILTSIAFIRDIDVILENLTIRYTDGKDGIIPVDVFARNKKVGGIDSYRLEFILEAENETYTQDFVFYQIPEEGLLKTFMLNLTNIPAKPYSYTVILHTQFDPDIRDNIIRGTLGFCPLPWTSDPRECSSSCDSTCINKFTGRYQASCRDVNRCKFYNESFAITCNGYLKDSFVPFNSTHEALCPLAEQFTSSTFSREAINITGDCETILITKFPVIFKGEFVIQDIIICK